ISCHQLPIIPVWAFTDYKVQGTSLQKVVVDLASAGGVQNAYVMLSRASSLSNLAILRSFAPHRPFGRLQEDLHNEFERLSDLDQKMSHWLHHEHL
ncbi:hypothetical protein PISMIDRAFT_113920, partial [Pisolithus microcarpus 441]